MAHSPIQSGLSGIQVIKTSQYVIRRTPLHYTPYNVVLSFACKYTLLQVSL